MTSPKWRALMVDGKLSALVHREAKDASGAYAIRRASTHQVLYVGESSRGNLWKTLLRHFQAPESFRKVRERGVFAGSAAGYEVALHVTSRGVRPRSNSKRAAALGRKARTEADQKAMAAQAAWIASLRPKLNVDDGRAGAELEREVREAQEANEREAMGRDWYENPRTYRAAHAAVLDELARLGWDVARSLKVPRATRRDGEVTIWFHPQAIYAASGRGVTAAASRSTGIDARALSPVAVVRKVHAWLGVPLDVDPNDVGGDARHEGPAGLLVGVAVGHDGRELWKAEAFTVAELIADADRMAPSARSVSIRADRTSDGAYQGLGNGKLVARREGGRWLVDGLPDVPQTAYLNRTPAELLRAVESGFAHSLPVAEVGANERESARELLSRGLIQALPPRGRFPRRYVVTGAGSHALGSFDSDARHFLDDSRNISSKLQAERKKRAKKTPAAAVAKPEAFGTVEAKGKHAGQLRMFNPGGVALPVGGLTAMGLLTCLEVGSESLRWNLRDAPILAYDKRGRLFIVYAGGVVRGSSELEAKEYKRTHWGQEGRGEVRGGGLAPAPFRAVGPLVCVTYTTKKGGDSTLVDYVHPFEGTLPRVVEHACKGGCKPRCAARGSLWLTGGTYRLESRGIVG